MRRLTVLPILAFLSGCAPAPDPVPEQKPERTTHTPGVPDGPVADRVKWLIAHIDDDPDLLHSDYSSAVHGLIDIGEPAILPALDLMLTSDDSSTRMRAQRVVEGVTLAQHGFVRGSGWKVAGGEGAWRRLMVELGSYDADAPEEQRRASVALWKKRFAKPTRELE